MNDKTEMDGALPAVDKSVNKNAGLDAGNAGLKLINVFNVDDAACPINVANDLNGDKDLITVKIWLIKLWMMLQFDVVM